MRDDQAREGVVRLTVLVRVACGDGRGFGPGHSLVKQVAEVRLVQCRPMASAGILVMLVKPGREFSPAIPVQRESVATV